jgi:putative PIN family toxin of toxin-antitoxin system
LASVTADTNIYISGLHFGGVPRRFLNLAAGDAFRLDISDAILKETLGVLRDKFKWSADALREVEADIRSYTNHVTPAQTVDVIKADPSDNRILECTVAAKSDYIVTGDTRHILPLGSYAGIPIVKVAPFLDLLGQLQGRQGAGIE